MGVGIEWDDHLIARFKALHQDGKRSFSAIAATLSREFGLALTKNACIGKARRLGLKVRPHVGPPPKRRPAEPPAEVIPAVIPRWIVETPALPPASERITIYQLDSGRCHYPFGSQPPYEYCGAAVRRGSWCPHHERVVYPRGAGR